MVGQRIRNSVAINGNAGAAVAIPATTFSRYVEIQEDNAAPQGLAVTWPDGTGGNYPVSSQPICIGNKQGAMGSILGPWQGIPANYNGSNNAATQYCTVKSMTATATSVRVTEWN